MVTSAQVRRFHPRASNAQPSLAISNRSQKVFSIVALVFMLFFGLGLVFFSYYIGYSVLVQLFFAFPIWFALLAALLLECGRVICVVAYRVHATNSPTPPSFVNKYSIYLVALFLANILFTYILLSNLLYAPNLQKQIDEDRKEIIALYAPQIASVDLKTDKAELSSLHEKRRKALIERRSDEIDGYKKERRSEMDNIVNGVWEGDRYRKFDQLVQETEQKLQQELKALDGWYAQQRLGLQSSFSAAEQLLQKRQEALDALRPAKYKNDPRVLNTMMFNAVAMFNQSSGMSIVYASTAFLLSVALAGLFESLVWLGWDRFTSLFIHVFF